MEIYTILARKSIEHYLKEKGLLSLPEDLPEEMKNKKAGVFVTLHTKEGELRGCIGTYRPMQDSIGEEIIRNAIEAAVRDPRFPPVQLKEMNDLNVEVSILKEPEPVEDPGKDLDPNKYGIIIKSNDGRSGLLLPGIEGVSSAQEQINIAGSKSGIDPSIEHFRLWRFETETHKEKRSKNAKIG